MSAPVTRGMAVRLLVVLLVAVLMSGCATARKLTGRSARRELPPVPAFQASVQPRMAWSVDTGSGTGGRYLRLPPALLVLPSSGAAGGASRLGVVAVGARGEVGVWEAREGRRVWSVDLDEDLSSGPGTGEGLVVVGTPEGRVHALDAGSGERRWSVPVSSEVLAAPRIADGVVVVRTIDGRITGLSARDGSRLWFYDREVPVLTLRGTSRPVVVGGLVVTGLDNGRLLALELGTGRVAWEEPVSAPRGRSELERMVDIDADPVPFGDEVYAVGFQGRLVALDPQTGAFRWRRDLSSYAGLAADEDHLFVADAGGVIWALDRLTSTSVWRQEGLQGRQLSPPAVAGGYVVIGDQEGYVTWLRKGDGQLAARLELDDDGISAPPVAAAEAGPAGRALAGAPVFVLGNSGTLAAFVIPEPGASP